MSNRCAVARSETAGLLNPGTVSPRRPSRTALRVLRPTPGAAMKLLLFPYAGAGPSVLSDLANTLPPWMEPVGVVYPGREERFDEPFATDLRQLADQLLDPLARELEAPCAFFGHSMGAILAYELCVRLDRLGKAPEALFLSGAAAPGVALPERLAALPAREFLAKLIALNGFPREALASAELISLMLPILRADFRLCEAHVDQVLRAQMLSLPIHAFAGAADPRAAPEQVALWRNVAGGEFRMHVYPGDHFFLRTHKQAMVAAIRDELAAGYAELPA